MSLLIVSLDSTIVNIALPAIHRSFHSALSGLQWTIDAYTLVLASLLMLSGSTADRLGRKRVFQVGLVLFSVGSLLCAVAPSLGMLIAARVLQAIGGSMLNPVAMSIIRNVFEEPRERAQAIGVWGGVIGISMALGPVLGGALVDSVGWRAVFLVNVPIGIVAIILTALYVPESRADRPRRLDPVGQILVILGLATLTYAIIDGPSAGWTAARTLGLFAISVISLTTLVGYELRRSEPLIEIRFFRSAPFAGATAIAVAMFAALGGFLFLNTLYLQNVRGLSPFSAGLYTLPMAGLMLVVSPLTGRFVGNRGTRLPLIGGSLALIASGVILAQLTAHTVLRPPDHRLRALRARLRADQSADHHHGDLRDAAVSSRRRRRRGVDRAPGRPDAGGRGARRAGRRRRGRCHGPGVRERHACELVDRGGTRRRDPVRGHGDHGTLGRRHGVSDRRAPARERSPAGAGRLSPPPRRPRAALP